MYRIGLASKASKHEGLDRSSPRLPDNGIVDISSNLYFWRPPIPWGKKAGEYTLSLVL